MKKRFSYVSLIATIFMLGLLVWIVYPRTAMVQEELVIEAKDIQQKVDTSSIQSAVNLYFTQNDELPVANAVSIGVPQQIDFTKLVTDFIRKAPSNTENYWIDSNAKVSYCPFKVDFYGELQASNSLVAWNLVEGVTKYHLYDLNAENGNAGSLGAVDGERNYINLNNVNPSAIYGVSMVDSAGNECPVIKVNQ